MDKTTTAQDALLNSYLHLFSIAILYYDWTLTFDFEISSIWRSPTNAPAMCFILNRYLSVIGNVFITVFNMKRQSLQSCKSYDLAHQIFIIANQAFVCVLLMLRTWALYGRDSRILRLMIGVALILLGTAGLDNRAIMRLIFQAVMWRIQRKVPYWHGRLYSYSTP